MSTVTVTKDTAVQYTDTELAVNREQFNKGIPDPPGAPYSVMEMNETIQRMNGHVVNSTLQGLVNALAALFNTETYRANYTRGVEIQYPADGAFTVDPFDPTIWQSYRVGNEPFDFDANGTFIAPAVPLLQAGSFGDTAFVYGQPDSKIDDQEIVNFVINQDGDQTQPIKYSFASVPSKETPTSEQIAVYTFGDPETVRDMLLTLPDANNIYDHIMSAGDYGFTWGRFKWDNYKWDSPKPGGLFPSRFDSFSKNINNTTTAHHNGVVNKATDLVLSSELSDDGMIQLQAGQVMWNGLKIFLAGDCHYLPELEEGEEQSTLFLADAASVAASSGTKIESLTLNPISRNVMAPSSVLVQPLLVLQTDDPAEIAYDTVTTGFTGTDPWTFVTNLPLFPQYDYTVDLMNANGTVKEFGHAADITVTPATNTISVVAAGLTKPAGAEYVVVFATRFAVDSDLSIDEALRNGYYPLFQHPWLTKVGQTYTEYDPNTIDIIDKNGDTLTRDVLAKHTETIFDPDSNTWDAYLNALNNGLRDFTVGGVNGRLCYTETENVDDSVTLKLKHTTNETYEADEVVWTYDAKEDGLRSTGIPKDTQQYDVDQALLFFAPLGDLGSCDIHTTASAIEDEVIDVIAIPRDVYGNRMTNTEFTITAEQLGIIATGITFITRLDGIFFFQVSVDSFTNGVKARTFTLNSNGTAISCSVTVTKNL